MTYLLQLHVYSGRPDPVWAISDAQATELFDHRQMEPQSLFEAQAATAERPADHGLGYRGFSLIDASGDHRPGALLAEGLAPAARQREAVIQHDPAAETMLLESGSHLLDPEVLRVVREGIARPPVIIPAPTRCPACHGATAPVYDPAYWNNDPNRLAHNNCYNYANNNATNTFAQPGRASGHMYTALDCPHVRAAAVSDGLVVAPNFTANTPGWYVALVIWPGQDYHWYRQDKNGCWSHKPGSTPARNVDNSGHTITDPKTCNRGPYTVFCTYMTTKKGIKIN